MAATGKVHGFYRLSGLRVVSAAVLIAAFMYMPRTGLADEQVKGGTGRAQTAPAICSVSFTDVQPTDYYFEAIRYLFCNGIASGYPDGSFHPGNPTTRGQLAKMQVLAEGWPLISPPTPSFTDVPTDSTFYAYIETARLHGILSGYSDGSFRPEANVTRAQLAKVVVLSEGWPLISPPTPSFIDVPAGNPFYSYVETAVARQVVSGYGGSIFRPGNPATRGQISKIVYFASAVHLTAQELQTVVLINQRRAQMGLSVLRINPALTLAARSHSADIGPRGLCQHNGTDGSMPPDRATQAGYAGFLSGEVVGCNYATPENVVNAWWASPSHYEVLTSSGINDIGCGWWVNGQGYGWQTCDTGISSR